MVKVCFSLTYHNVVTTRDNVVSYIDNYIVDSLNLVIRLNLVLTEGRYGNLVH